jgi:FKBP-type peptidyl-prolyl cis-trans isomerase
MNYLLIIFLVVLSAIVFLLFKQLFAKEKKRTIPTAKILSTSTPKEGVQVDTLKFGSGPEALRGKKVNVHYTAWLENGTKVDSSYDKGESFVFKLGNREVIPGWEAGMLGMKQGEVRKFTISPDQAYGASGKANVPPDAVIVFEVELLKVY